MPGVNIEDRTMAGSLPHNDSPISDPSKDRFGIDPFAKALASGILKLATPDGSVIALNGPWGSGKTSAVNLIIRHLALAVQADELAIINFQCWWFRGEEALALAFFRELYTGLGPSLGDRFKKAMPKLGSRLLKAGGVVAPAIDLMGGGGSGKIASDAMKWAADLIKQTESVEKLYGQISKALAEQDRRFLIIIDDIDRLAPDEALLIFRLIKSVGRLPNVIYLLVFDRTLADAIVREKYPSEGPQYLEKIIQASFDIPSPRPEDLRDQLLEQIERICGSPDRADLRDFMNIFYDVVAPEMQRPRDVVRLTNALSVTWPAIGADVDRADFVGLETLRLLQPSVYLGIKANKDRLTGGADRGNGRYSNDQKKEYDDFLLSGADPKDRERLRKALKRLFPRLESVWGNLSYGEDSIANWERRCRLCARSRFDVYFRLSVGNDVLRKEEIECLLRKAGDGAFVKDSLLSAVDVLRSGGGTKAALILDELNLHAESIVDEDVQALLAAIFEVADRLDVLADEARAFSIGDNRLRIHWLLRRLTLARFDLERRSAILVAACENASIGWLVDLADSTDAAHHPREGKAPRSEEELITTEKDADALRLMALDAIRAAATSNCLISHPKLPHILFRWQKFARDEGKEVKRWTKSQLEDDRNVVTFAQRFTSHGWSQSIADRVAERTTVVHTEGLDLIIDARFFRKRVKTLLAGKTLSHGDRAVLSEFEDAWARQQKATAAEH